MSSPPGKAVGPAKKKRKSATTRTNANVGNTLNDAASYTTAGESHFQGCWQQALHAHQKALAIRAAQQSHDEEAMAESHLHVGYALEQTGNVQEALLHCERALEIKRRLNNDHKTLELMIHVGGLTERLGMLDEALAVYQEALILVEQLEPDSGIAADAHSKIGVVWQRKGEAKAPTLNMPNE